MSTEITSVEELVRNQLSKAMGGWRGSIESALPTVVFTAVYLPTKNLKFAIIASAVVATLFLLWRLKDKTTTQYVLNAFFGIAIGALFVVRAANSGGTVNEQALAYFQPGILLNAVYGGLMLVSVLLGWPLLGIMIGAVTGNPTGWRTEQGIRKLCSKLTLILALPCLLRVLVQGSIYLAATRNLIDQNQAIAWLGTLRILMGWPLQITALVTMGWLLSRNKTPLKGN